MSREKCSLWDIWSRFVLYFMYSSMSIGFLLITISFTKIILTNVFIIIILFHVIINRDRFGRWLSSVFQNEGALVVHFCLVLLGDAS